MRIASGTFEAFADRWECAFRLSGATPHQSPGHIRAESRRHDAAAPVVIEAGGALSAFRRNGRLASCLIEGAGALTTGETPFSPRVLLDSVRERLDVETVHIPLLYPDLPLARALLEVEDAARLERRPSVIMAPPFDADTIQTRCEARLGSRARRRLVRFDNAGPVFERLVGAAAIEVLDVIERRCWKAAFGQDMHSRGQFEAYANRLSAGDLSLSAAIAAGTPIAYRLETMVGWTLFALKWSFDEAWRRVSPGFALLVVDLPARCRETGANLVDLFGSPDQLKDALSTGFRRRVELAWPAGPLARNILQEVRAHDARNEAAYARGESIRAAYVGETRDRDHLVNENPANVELAWPASSLARKMLPREARSRRPQ